MVAARHGWSLDALSIFELIPAEAILGENRELTIFQPAELELSETTKLILDQVKAIDPVRIVFDGLSEMRLLAQDALRYRRQILALKQFFAGRRSTVLLLDDLTSQATDQQLHSIAHGVVTLEQMALDTGRSDAACALSRCAALPSEAAIMISRSRGVVSRSSQDWLRRSITMQSWESTPNGNGELDAMLGGGLERGTTALLIGGAGVGKSSIALTYAVAAAKCAANIRGDFVPARQGRRPQETFHRCGAGKRCGEVTVLRAPTRRFSPRIASAGINSNIDSASRDQPCRAATTRS